MKTIKYGYEAIQHIIVKGEIDVEDDTSDEDIIEMITNGEGSDDDITVDDNEGMEQIRNISINND